MKPPVALSSFSGISTLRQFFSERVDAGSLAFFRIFFGTVMALEAWALVHPNTASISFGTTPLDTYYTGPDITFNLPYPLFQWLPFFSPAVMRWIVNALAVGGLMMALGLFYRFSALLVFLTWGYLFAVESTRTYWQSHYYLEILISALMVFLPASKSLSLDSWLAKRRGLPGDGLIPRWPLFLLRAQLLIAYFYAGVAKLTVDWLADAVPVRWFLNDPAALAPFATILSPAELSKLQNLIQSTGFAYFIAYSGMLFDLSIGFLLICRRTRLFGFVCMVLFHATNHFLIFDDIGWFPLLGILTATIFLDPAWPHRLWQWLRRPVMLRPDWKWFWGGLVLIPGLGAFFGWKSRPSPVLPPSPNRLASPVVIAGVCGWIVWQALFPLRHFLIAGDARITYEGLSFSWRLKAERHGALPFQLFVDDPAVVSNTPSGQVAIHWENWAGPKAVYREVDLSGISLTNLPKFFVTLEPLTGHRIFFNPGEELSPGQAAREINEFWQTQFGHLPGSVIKTSPLSAMLSRIAQGLSQAGNGTESTRLMNLALQATRLESGNAMSESAATSILDAVADLAARDSSGQIFTLVSAVHPFASSGLFLGSAPFYCIQDEALASGSHLAVKLLQELPTATASEVASVQNTGGNPLWIYLTDLGLEARENLPLSFIQISTSKNNGLATIRWNSLRDLPPSKFLHISNQPFFLRRYALRVAALWKQNTGRKPAIHAKTFVSINGRPYQPLVDPATDLASTKVNWFRHNDWIMDLQTPRIPRENLSREPR